MTTVATWNKGSAPAGGNGWNLTPDVRLALESMNVIVPVANQSERDSLTPPLGKYVGMAVSRADLNGLIEVWNGSTWLSPVKRRHAEFTGIQGGSSGTTGAGAAWGLSLLTEVTAAKFSNTFVVPGAASKLTFTEAGVYSVTLKLKSASAPGLFYCSIKNGADTDVFADGNNGGVDWGATACIPNILIANAFTDILFGLRTANAVGVTAAITVQKISD